MFMSENNNLYFSLFIYHIFLENNMKKSFISSILFIFSSLHLFAAWDGTTIATSFAGGDGTRSNPYQIATCEQFAYLAQSVNATPNYSRGKYFKLTADLIFNEAVLKTTNDKLKKGDAFPVSPTMGEYKDPDNYIAFQGVFDGDGHIISGLYLVDWSNAFSLFRALDGATVKNLIINDSYIYSGSNLGFIAAAVYDSNILNCQVVNSQMDSWASTSGAICGRTFRTTRIQNCYANVTINAKNCCGGICGMAATNQAGFVNDVVIENCLTDCQMTYTKDDVKAGVAYYMYAKAVIRDNWFSGNTTNDFGVNTWSEGLDREENNNYVTDLSATIAALNAKSSFIPGACRWNADGTLNFSEKTAEGEGIDINALVTDPIPADADYHVVAQDGCVHLSWTASADGRAVKYNLYIASSKEGAENATIPTAIVENATYPIEVGNTNDHYYWRVDAVHADGSIVKGVVWTFQTAVLAFPGAEGYGRYAHGGRGGKVVYVTNLSDDDSEGSLRWALTNDSGPRTVLFKVSGIIDMHYKTCCVDDNVTIAAQTAPGKGICVIHSDIALGNDNVCRFLRARRGLGTSDDTGNAIGMTGNNSIMDHVSLAWGTDETFSSRGAKNITFSNSMISEALGRAGHRNYPVGTNHGYAATIGGDIGTFSHNLVAHCYGRNWSMGGGTDASGAYSGRLDIFNNVVYNWGHRATDGGAMEVNFVNNYYKCGPATDKTQIFTLEIEGDLKGSQSAYVAGNVRDNFNGSITKDKQGETFDVEIKSSRSTPVTWQVFADKPFFESYATIDKAEDAYKKVLSDNGANQPCLDEHDQRIINETLNRTFTYTGSKSGIKGQLDSEDDCGGLEIYPETAFDDNYDSDNNGIPQWFEAIGETHSETMLGFPPLDSYLHFLANPHVVLANGTSKIIDLKSIFAGYTNAPVYSVIEKECEPLVKMELNGSKLTLTALKDNVIEGIPVEVSDAEGSHHLRTIYVAVTSDATAVTAINDIPDFCAENTVCIVSTLDGKVLGSGTSLKSITANLPSGIYAVKVGKRSAKMILR